MKQKKGRFSFSRNQLKLLMAVTMVADHVGYMLVSPLQEASGAIVEPAYPVIYYILRLAGRLSFPIVCFFLVQGVYFTHDRKRYLLRLFIFALLSEIPFDLAINQRLFDWKSQNVLFTLVLGLCVLYLLEWAGQIPDTGKRVRTNLAIVLGGMMLAYVIRSDYSYWGILVILVFYLGRFQKRQRFWAMLVLCACQGVGELFAVLALFFTENYDTDKGTKQSLFQKYFFYLFYPLHLLALYGLQGVL